jgi:hypothetical protein
MGQPTHSPEPHLPGDEPSSLAYAANGSYEPPRPPYCSIVGCVLSSIAFLSFCLAGIKLARSVGGREWDGLGEAMSAFICFLCFAGTGAIGMLLLLIGAWCRQRLAFYVLPILALLYAMAIAFVPSIRSGVVIFSQHIR